MAKRWPPPKKIQRLFDPPYWVRRWFMASEWRWLYRRFIGFFVRGWRGWAPHDTWGLDHYIARILADALPHLATNVHGYPPEFYPDGGLKSEYTREESDAAFDAWIKWLYDKAEWFDWYAKDDDGISDDRGWITPGMSKEEKHRRIEAHNAKMKEFYEVVLPDFIKHFGSLWD